MTSEWLRFPARWGEFAANRNRLEHFWMPRAHLATAELAGHRPLCWKTTFAQAPVIQGGVVDDEYQKCGKCARMEKK